MVLYKNKIVCNCHPALLGTGNGNVFSPDFSTAVILTQEEYDALEEKSSTTLYFIRG